MAIGDSVNTCLRDILGLVIATSMAVTAAAADEPDSCLSAEQRSELSRRQFERITAITMQAEYPRIVMRRTAMAARDSAQRALAACEADQTPRSSSPACAAERDSLQKATDELASIRSEDTQLRIALAAKIAATIKANREDYPSCGVGGAVKSAAPDGCVSEIETVAAAALRETFSPQGKFPDFSLVGEKAPVLLRSEVRGPACVLSDGALFGGIRGGFVLRSTAQLQADADASKTRQVFVVVQSVDISANEATVRLGVDLLLPRSSTSIKLCCCEQEAVLGRIADQWQFSRWGAGMCS
jgi:hypothetical protein